MVRLFLLVVVFGGGEGGVGVPPVPFAPPGTLLEQYTYDPYGAILFGENFDIRDDGTSGHAVNRVGHQGLFFERFDGSYTDPTLAEGGLPGLGPNAQATGLYYNRNRFYHPQLGRFLTRDPNETALPILTALASNGEALNVLLGGFDGVALYGNGLNLYEYAAGNPVRNRDALGLDIWDDFDDAMDDLTGHRLYAIGMLNEGARMASIGLNLALDIGGSLLGVDIFQSVLVLANGRGGFWDAMNLAVAAVPGGGPLKAIGKAAKYRRMARAGGHAIDVLANLSKWQRGYDMRLLAEAAQKYPKLAGKIHKHHVIPNYMLGPELKKMGIKSPPVDVDAAYHQLITNAFRKEWGYGKGPPKSMAKLEEILNKVYSQIPLP